MLSPGERSLVFPCHGSDQRLILLPQSRIVRLQLVQSLKIFMFKHKIKKRLILSYLVSQIFRKCQQLKLKRNFHVTLYFYIYCDISN